MDGGIMMNVPRKHHYVPRVHIRKFESSDGYHVFQKKQAKFLNLKSSRAFFAIKDLNSTVNTDTGEVDHSTIENELAKKWDDKFNYHYDVITTYISRCIIDQKENPETIHESLLFFFEYGLINYLRFKKVNQSEASLEWIEELVESLQMLTSGEEFLLKPENLKVMSDYGGIEKLIGQIESYGSKLKELKFPSPTPTNVSFLIPTSCSCDIILSTNEFFILPDCSAVVISSKELCENHGIQTNKISCVGLPIAPNILLQIKNNEVCSDTSNGLYRLEANRINEINRNIYKKAQSQILCRRETKDAILKMAMDRNNDG